MNDLTGKPTVRYLRLITKPHFGMGVLLQPLDHPFHDSQKSCTTSPVMHIQETPFGPEIETQNTFYVPLVSPEGFATLEESAL